MKSILYILLLFGCCLTLYLGDTPWNEIWNNVQARLSGQGVLWNPLLDERIPRLIVLLSTGAAMAVAGAVMQSLFQNPLASPSILGTSCGGTLSIVIVMIFGWHINHPYAIPMAGCAGCLAALLLVYWLSRHQSGVQLNQLILTGIAVSTLLLAIQEAIIYSLRDQWQLIQTLTEWEAGSTYDRSWKHVHMQLPLTLIGLAGCWNYRKEIDILALGDEEAKNLGVEVAKVRWRLFLCVALLTGGAISAVGVVSFFGLILPHMIRKITGPRFEHMFPFCVVGGGITLIFLDLALRLFEIRAFSIGNIAAILGGLFFLIILTETKKKEALC